MTSGFADRLNSCSSLFAGNGGGTDSLRVACALSRPNQARQSFAVDDAKDIGNVPQMYLLCMFLFIRMLYDVVES